VSVRTEQRKVDLGDHAVHFYRDDADLADTVGQYLVDALGEPGVAVVIATDPHVKAFERRLAAAGTDVEVALESGRLIFLDARATLAKLTVGGQIDGQAFDDEVGRLVRGVVGAGGTVRAYGEMVDLLWQAGEVSSAIELERLWNELIDELRFSLLCAYRSATAAAPEREHALREVCGLHSAVSSTAGSDTFPSNGEDPWRGIAREFQPEDDAPRAARRFLDEALHELGHGETLLDDARQVISELVTNAVRHGRSRLLVSVHTQGSSVRLAVHDQSPAQPAARQAAPDAVSGRGLQIVAALSRNWGVETTAGGKTVWAEI
jgi:anti-sigma regulatory factor (Ser/Thr protein kinase)